MGKDDDREGSILQSDSTNEAAQDTPLEALTTHITPDRPQTAPPAPAPTVFPPAATSEAAQDREAVARLTQNASPAEAREYAVEETLPELTKRAGDNSHRLTFVFAAGQRKPARELDLV